MIQSLPGKIINRKAVYFPRIDALWWTIMVDYRKLAAEWGNNHSSVTYRREHDNPPQLGRASRPCQGGSAILLYQPPFLVE